MVIHSFSFNYNINYTTHLCTLVKNAYLGVKGWLINLLIKLQLWSTSVVGYRQKSNSKSWPTKLFFSCQGAILKEYSSFNTVMVDETILKPEL